MIIQDNNKNIRYNDVHKNDIDFLKNYYALNGKFPLFKHVLIETRTDCNNRCPFCPQSHYNKEVGIMSWDCYTAIISQLCDIDFNGRVALMLSNEPLLEERLIKMISYAKSASQRFFLDITTNGKLLTTKLLDDLFKAGLDNININDYRSDRDKNDILSPNIEDVYSHYGDNPKVTIKKRRTDEVLPNYAGIIKQEFDSSVYGFCNYPFRKMTIAYTGDILLCCDDFSYKTNFGNIMHDKLIDCWNNAQLNHIRKALLDNQRIGICANCNDIQDYKVF